MFRLVLSIILVIAFAGASAASVMHGLNHGSEHSDHHADPHAQMTQNDLLADAEKALAECCDATSDMGSTPCFGDLVVTPTISPVQATSRTASGLLCADCGFSNLTLAVPTGPPKV